MRVRRGAVGEVGLTVVVPAGRQAHCYDGCSGGDAQVLPVPIPYGTVAYGEVIDEHVGLLLGAAFPAGRIDGLDSNWDGDLAPRVFGLATLQDRWFAQCRNLITIGVSPDVLRNMVVEGRAARDGV